jgi:hypothetical protein
MLWYLSQDAPCQSSAHGEGKGKARQVYESLRFGALQALWAKWCWNAFGRVSFVPNVFIVWCEPFQRPSGWLGHGDEAETFLSFEFPDGLPGCVLRIVALTLYPLLRISKYCRPRSIGANKIAFGVPVRASRMVYSYWLVSSLVFEVAGFTVKADQPML